MSIMRVLEMAALLIELFLASDEGWSLKVSRMLEMRGRSGALPNHLAAESFIFFLSFHSRVSLKSLFERVVMSGSL